MMINRIDWIVPLTLIALAAFIWLRDTVWISTADDTLPILVALPLFWWIGSPWKWRSDPHPLDPKKIMGSAFLFLIGIALNLTFCLALGWTLLLWTWLSSRMDPDTLPSIKKLLILPLMAFPWIALDADRLGWWFRLSGAYTTAGFFALQGVEVHQEGTEIIVNKLPISVEAACAGLNTLQSMLIAGSVVAYLTLGNTPRYWWNMPILVAVSWIANTLRIILISLAALYISPTFATGAFHTWGGWVVILVMFSLCWLIFSLLQPKEKER